MTRLAASAAREDFADLLDTVRHTGERVVVHKHGKDVAVIVSIEDFQLLEALEDKLDLDAAREALADPKRISWEKVKRELGL